MSGTTSSSAVLNDTTITGNVIQSADKQSTFGAVTIGGTTRINTTDLFFGDGSTQVSASGTVFANLSGIITTGRIQCDVLDINTTFNYTGGSIGTFGSIELRGGTGIISCTDVICSGIVSCLNMNATAGVTTVFDLDISDGNNTNLLIKKVGFNTTLNGIGIAEGIEMYDNAEISMQGQGGIGIGTTSGKRSPNIDLYVGYRRDDVGAFLGGDVLFEGAVGIGTKVELSQGNAVEVYKNVHLFSNHTGIGGTEGAGIVRVGFDTALPQSSIDLGESEGSIILSRRTEAQGTPQFGRPGLLWYNTTNNYPEIYTTNNSTVGIKTILNETHDPNNVLEELGFLGGIVDSDLQRRQRLQADSIDNYIQPGPEFGLANSVGFGTAHMLYNKAYDKHQYATQQGSSKTDASIFRSYVSSGTSALNIELDSTGTKVFITIAGVGSATLSLV